MSRIMWHSCAPWALPAPSGYGTQTAIWIQKLTEMGHEVIVVVLLGALRGAHPVERDHDPPGVRRELLFRVAVPALQGSAA